MGANRRIHQNAVGISEIYTAKQLVIIKSSSTQPSALYCLSMVHNVLRLSITYRPFRDQLDLAPHIFL